MKYRMTRESDKLDHLRTEIRLERLRLKKQFELARQLDYVEAIRIALMNIASAQYQLDKPVFRDIVGQ